MLNSEFLAKAQARAGRDKPLRRIRRKIVELDRWLDEHGNCCRASDNHLKQGSSASAYWHFGYMAALQDVVKTFKEQLPQS